MSAIPRPADSHGTLGRSRRMMLLDTSMKVLYPSILVLGLYFLFAGHNRPGGGFVGGLVVGGALALRYVSGGAAAVRSTFRLPPHLFLGLGLLMSASTAFIPVVLGGSILEHGDATFHLPVFDTVKVTSALSFDIGVDLIVIGLILMAFEAFGEDEADPTVGRSRERAARLRGGVPLRHRDLDAAAAPTLADPHRRRPASGTARTPAADLGRRRRRVTDHRRRPTRRSSATHSRRHSCSPRS